MLWNEIKTDWNIVSKQFRTKWPKLTDADLKAIGGKRDELLKRLEQHYEIEKPKLEKQVDEFIKTLKAKA